MKGWLGILFLLGGAGLAAAQTALPSTSPVAEPPGAVCPQADVPQLLLPHTSLPLLTDSAYLISPARYRFYQQLHRYVLDTTARAGDSLVTSYARSLQETQHAYETLLERHQTSSQLATQTLRNTQIGLGQLGRTLDQTQYALEQTARSLEAAEAQARVARRRSLVRHLVFGAGGIGAGLALGLLLP